MFIWVTQGLVEPYTPKVRDESIKKINPLHPGIPDKPLEVGDPEDSIEITHYKSGNQRGGKEYVANFYSQEEAKVNEERKQVLYAKDIMSTILISIFPDDPISKIEKLFQSNRFRHMPVIDKDNALLGILSERDLLKSTIENLRNENPLLKNEIVVDIMQSRVLSAFPETPIREIARIMFEEVVGSVPILNKENNKLVGIVTRSDILRQVMNNPPLDLYT